MTKITAPLLIDFYKATHDLMLPKGITKSVSYMTHRMSRIERWNKAVVFMIQGFCKEFLIDYFNENFFHRSAEEVFSEYNRIMKNCLGVYAYDSRKIVELYALGYLPIEIVALPEGTQVPMQVPLLGITNTHPNFAWLPQALESLMSAELWKPMIAATVGFTYRNIVNHYYNITCDDDIPRARALGNFDFRGDDCLDSAIKTAAAWGLSFLNSATVPAIPYLEEIYNCDCEKEPVLYGSPSTEHAVMCSNFAVDGDEETLIRRLLTEIYPNTSFSCVLDSYDYWNVVDNILPKLYNEIMKHNGCFLVRGDSGDCVEVVTKTVFKLWDIFGGTVNSKGYKVLDPHVKAIYGDSITVQRCEKIYQILMENGFACSNVALGVGSFSFQCIEENGVLKPFTRDTFSTCIKATYCEINGKPYPIFKDPKEGGFKRSQKGCCVVFEHGVYQIDKDCDLSELSYIDGYTWEAACADSRNMLQPIFRDGKMLKEYTLSEIRNTLNGGKF
mgnify:CR=1 FL=1